MKVTLYMAMSANGMIARVNGEEDFLSEDNWLVTVELAKQTGNIIWGRKTHEAVSGWEERYHQSIKDALKVIVSSDSNFKIEKEDYLVVRSPEEALNVLSEKGFTEAFLSGGSTINSSFAKLGLIDEVIVNIEAILIGKGIPVFSQEDFDLDLELQEVKQLDNEIVQLHYKVKN